MYSLIRFPNKRTLFLGVVDFMVIPVLMLSFIKNAWLGFVLNVATVLCFTGLHEVAREVESPFQNVPNDVPLNNFQAQFNEGLMVMFYGYHPDAYWDVDETMKEIMNEFGSTADGGGGSVGANNQCNDRGNANTNSNSKSGNAMEATSQTKTSDKRPIAKPTLTAFNPTPPTTMTSLALADESEPTTNSLGTKPTVSSSSSSSEERHLLGKKKKLTKIRVDDQHVDEEDEMPGIEAYMASLSQSESFPSTCSSPPPPSTTTLRRNEAFTDFAPAAVAIVDEEREEYDNLCGISRTLSADQMDLLQAKERQQQLVEAQQLQQQQQQERHQKERSSLTFDSAAAKPPQVSFLIPNMEGEDSSVVYVNDDDRDIDNCSINTYENDENEQYIL
jgi:hypothetical protein